MPLNYGELRTLYVDAEAWVFIRHYMGDWTIVGINVRNTEKSITVELPAFAECGSLDTAVATEGAAVKCLGNGKIEVTLPAYGYIIANK